MHHHASKTVKVTHFIGIMHTMAVLMTAIFVLLKLAGYVSWSWLAAFSPIIVVAALKLAILMLFAIVAISAVFICCILGR